MAEGNIKIIPSTSKGGPKIQFTNPNGTSSGELSLVNNQLELSSSLLVSGSFKNIGNMNITGSMIVSGGNVLFNPNVTDSTNAEAYVFNTNSSITSANAKTFIIKNNGVEEFSISRKTWGYDTVDLNMPYWWTSLRAGNGTGRLDIMAGSLFLDIANTLWLPESSFGRTDIYTSGQCGSVAFSFQGNILSTGFIYNGFRLDTSTTISGSYNLNLIVSSSHPTLTDGITALSVAQNGNIGINNQLPTSKLHISGSTNSESLLNIQNNIGNNLLFVSSSGNVGIGTTMPNTKLDVNGNTTITGSLAVTTNINGNGTLYIQGSSSFKSRIDMTNTTNNWISYGAIGYNPPGNNSTGEKIQLYGIQGQISNGDYAIGIESNYLWFNTGGGGFKWYNAAVEVMRIDSSTQDLIVQNNIYAYQDIVAYYSSDSRLKDNLQPIENNINKLNAYKYTWNKNADKDKVGKEDYGLIAQEVQEVYPEIVQKRSDGYLGINYIKLVPILFSYIKDLNNEITNLTNRIQKLEEK